jgi:transcriptional regulator with PAS, ATPase and Fis domain
MDKQPPIDLQSVIDAQDNPFVLIDENYNIVSANKTYCETYGMTPEEVIGHKCHKVSHHSDVPCHQNGEDCPHKQVFTTWKPHQVLHVHYDKNKKPDRVRIKGSPVNGADGKRYLGEAIFRLGQSDELDCSEQHIIGKAPAFLAFLEQLSRAAETSASVLLQGESGTGKDVAAQYIHKSSDRSGSSLIHLSCSSVDDALCESELFGHEKGAFNGCVGRRFGMFESADGGTLFIKEIDQLPFSLQGKLIRALEAGTYRRVGGEEELQANVRIVSATHRNLLEMVEDGTFRADLYYRIAGIKVEIPPLRERRQDIPPLTETLLASISSAANKKGTLTEKAMEKLLAYDFPGNLHELRNILQQALIVSTNGIITPELINLESPARQFRQNRQGAREGTSIREVEAKHIADLLAKFGGHRRKVADELGISERTLYRKLDKYDLNDVGRRA